MCELASLLCAFNKEGGREGEKEERESIRSVILLRDLVSPVTGPGKSWYRIARDDQGDGRVRRGCEDSLTSSSHSRCLAALGRYIAILPLLILLCQDPYVLWQ